MLEWKEAVQEILDWIEDRLDGSPTLLELSAHVGYSPCYCSYLFHQVTGKTLKSYLAGRRLYRATLALRDTEKRILDIALETGYQSQEALTRAFARAYGCTPAAYRRQPRPLPLPLRQTVLLPEDFENGGLDMRKLKEANIRFEFIPAHRYLGVWEPRAADYGEFWKYHDCDELCGVIESMRNVSDEIVGCHMAGWYHDGGRRCYFYGLGVPADYDGGIPKGFELREFPASLYLVFFHPPFDYNTENGEVMGRVEKLAWDFEPVRSAEWAIMKDYEWNEDACQAYQRHYPEVLGYEVLRPVRPRK